MANHFKPARNDKNWVRILLPYESKRALKLMAEDESLRTGYTVFATELARRAVLEFIDRRKSA